MALFKAINIVIKFKFLKTVFKAIYQGTYSLI